MRQEDCDVEISLGYTVKMRTCSFQLGLSKPRGNPGSLKNKTGEKKAKIKRAVEKTFQQGAQDAEAETPVAFSILCAGLLKLL